MAMLTSSVGVGGVNRESDVRAVQTLLNQQAQALAATPLAVNGLADERTLAAIRLFQSRVMHLRLPMAASTPVGEPGWR